VLLKRVRVHVCLPLGVGRGQSPLPGKWGCRKMTSSLASHGLSTLSATPPWERGPKVKRKALPRRPVSLLLLENRELQNPRPLISDL
jgi:hypothetical protein